MINFDFAEAYAALAILNYHCTESFKRALESRKKVIVEFADDPTKKEALKVLTNCRAAFGDIGSRGLRDRISRFRDALGRPLSLEDLAAEFRFLRETIQDEIKHHHFYHYPPEMGALLVGFEDNWKPVIKAFPSTADEASAAVDCIALGHGTAGVFHLMRVLEYGIGALAGQVGKTFDKQMWHGIIDEIESAIKQLQKTASKEEREKKLAFLSEAALEFRYFKDTWRNHVSHNKSSYDENQAIGVMNHVLSFMRILSKNGLAEWMG
jgi:hypothetical protein